MKLTRHTPSLHLGRVADFGPWLRQPLAGFPAVAQLLEDFFPTPAAPGLSTDLFEDKDHFFARFELPGVKKEAVKVELRERALSVSAERRDKSGESETAYTLSRVIALPDLVQEDAISAKLEDGILTVTLPKHEQRKPKVISVN